MTATEPPTAESQHIFKPGLFEGQIALVTGGGSGIGFAAAAELARLGAKVAICGRTAEKLDSARPALAELAGADERVLSRVCDIRAPEQVEALVAALIDAWGRVDLLVNNAGGQFPAPAASISPNGFAAVVRNNLDGTFNMTREVAVKSMIPNRGGRVVNVIANIYRGFPGMVHTGAARAGVENMTMTLAVEWAEFGILVNAVAPGVIRSSGTKRYPPSLLVRAVEQTPLHRVGSVDEVAASILFLCSPAAQFITGATLRIDGAQSLAGEIWPPSAF